MGLVLARVGRYEEAAAAYAECLRIDPNYTQAQEALDAVQGKP
jgi:tetratricopeptide (TPR) repeat protein